jgi:hypothetical protein
MEKSLVLVGASYAATHLRAAARDQGFTGKILLVGEERRAPFMAMAEMHLAPRDGDRVLIERMWSFLRCA